MVVKLDLETETNQRTKKSPRTVVKNLKAVKPWSGSNRRNVRYPPPHQSLLEILGRVFNISSYQRNTENTPMLCTASFAPLQLSQHVRMVSQPQCCHWRLVPGCPVFNWSLGKMWLGVVERGEVVTQLPPHPPKK